MSINNLIKARRIKLGLSQDDVAKAVGVNETTVSRWESGKIANMKSSRLAALGDILQIDPIILMISYDKSIKKDTSEPPRNIGWIDSDIIADDVLVNPDSMRQRGEISLNAKEQALNILLAKYGLSFNKYTTKGTLSDYGFIGREGGVSFTADKFNNLMDAIEDSILRIYVRFANEGDPEWLQRRRKQKYGLEDLEE